MKKDGESLSYKYEYTTVTPVTIPHNYKSICNVQRVSSRQHLRLTAANAASSTVETRIQHPISDSNEQLTNMPQRSNKAKTLQQQFETLKRKIKEVENKNERILDKIHNTQENERKRSLERKPTVFEVNYQHPFSDTYTRIRSNLYAQERERADSRNRIITSPHDKYLRTQQIQSLKANSRDSQHNLGSRNKRDRKISQLKAFVKQLQGKNIQLSSYIDKQKIKYQSCNSQLMLADEKLKKEHLRLETVKGNFRNYAKYSKQIIQNNLDRFMDSLLNTFLQIDKKNKRNHEKLDGLLKQIKRHSDNAKLSNVNVKHASLFRSGSAMFQKDELQKDKSKSRDLENIVAKYEQMIKSKNQEYDGLMARLKLKEKEYTYSRQSIQKLTDEKRKLQLQSEQKLTDLESIVSILKNENRALREEINRIFQNKGSTDECHSSRLSIRSMSSDVRQENEKKQEQMLELTNRLNVYEMTIIEKNNLVISLQRDLLANKGKYTELFNEYQESLQKVKSASKQKTDELAATINDLKSQLQRKDEHLLLLQEKERMVEEKFVELQMDYNNIKDRLELKARVSCTLSKENNKDLLVNRSQEDDLLEFRSQPNSETEQPNSPVSNPQQNKSTMENSRILLIRIQQLTKENRNLQVEMIHSKSEAQLAKAYKLQMDQLDIRNKQQELRIQQLLEQIEDLHRHLREPSEMNISIGSTIKSVRGLESNRYIASNHNDMLIVAEIEAENIKLNTDLINLRKDYELSERKKEQLVNRNKQLKMCSEQLEKSNQQLQQAFLSKSKEYQQFRNITDQKFRALQDERRTLQTELQSRQEGQKTVDKVGRRSSNNLKLKDIEIDKLTAKLTDFEDDLRQKDALEKKLSESYRLNIANLKQQMEELKVENLRTTETVKLQSLKIRQLELEISTCKSEAENNDELLSNNNVLKHHSHEAKIKQLEVSLLEANIAKVTLEAHLKTSEQNNSQLMNETSEVLSELETKKNELAKLVAIYEERLKEQELIINSYQKQKKFNGDQINDKFGVSDRRKSDLNNHSSNVRSNIHIEHEDDLQELASNIEQILDNEEYYKLRLRRKDQTKLLEKTGQYIKKLKEVIKQKNKKIRILEKRVQSMRSSPHKFNKSTSLNTQPHAQEIVQGEDDEDSIRDNYSVKMQNKKDGSQRKLRQLQNQTHLTIQENHLLLHQVENLQDELTRAEEQENGLIRMKQIYKEEISKLRTLCEQRQMEILRLKQLTRTNLPLRSQF